MAGDLPSDSFQITLVSLVGVRRPLKEILEALNNPGVDALGSLDLSTLLSLMPTWPP